MENTISDDQPAVPVTATAQTPCLPLSKFQFSELQLLMEKRKNQEFVINDSDKNLGAAVAGKKDVIKE